MAPTARLCPTSWNRAVSVPAPHKGGYGGAGDLGCMPISPMTVCRGQVLSSNKHAGTMNSLWHEVSLLCECHHKKLQPSEHGREPPWTWKEIPVDLRSSMLCRNQTAQPRASPWEDSAPSRVVLQKGLGFYSALITQDDTNAPMPCSREDVYDECIGSSKRVFLCMFWFLSLDMLVVMLGGGKRTCLGQKSDF